MAVLQASPRSSGEYSATQKLDVFFALNFDEVAKSRF
jgi:hypothetical protein